MEDGETRVFGEPSTLADGREYHCYTVEWIGAEPPTAIEFGGVTYLAVTEPDGKVVKRNG